MTKMPAANVYIHMLKLDLFNPTEKDLMEQYLKHPSPCIANDYMLSKLVQFTDGQQVLYTALNKIGRTDILSYLAQHVNFPNMDQIPVEKMVKVMGYRESIINKLLSVKKHRGLIYGKISAVINII